MAKFIFYDDKLINILLKEELPSGGAAVQAYGWIQGLLASTQDVYLLTEPKSDRILKDECFKIKIIEDYDPSKGIKWIRWAYYRIPHIYNTLRYIKPDFVYKSIPTWHSSILAVICYLLNIQFIQRVSNDFLVDDRFYTKYSQTHRLFQNIAFKLSSFILCQNEYQYRIIKYKFPNKVVHKISNPIVLESSNYLDEGKQDSYIAWLGLFQYQKNLKLLYHIATNLANQTFLIAGKEGSKVDTETIEYLTKLRELPNVKFIGFLQRHEVLPFLAKSKYLLNTSRYEGFSNTFLEAMATGTPILTTEQVNPDSIISDHRLGIIYEDPQHLNQKLNEITPTAYEALSKRVTDYVKHNHDYLILTNRLLNLLKTDQTAS
ncbi:glycosyltransferase family 4 protein [Pontibacter virosus]|uniref:Glycosyltransferase involved in cell wall biosynthesis n=1 Tax=Pontibacter virosus TaxID=1765052 RepID=A0A2U1AJZ4_9BACT|nr:glycosyltransferase [Pontibacter virosus]PVY36667.1 glycosyltransferase involved in cell wall biosynthesis [Pontibacter virosus]